jgi:hypothetical protein
LPAHLETFSTCAGPHEAVPHHRMGGIAGLFIAGWTTSTITKILLAIAGGALWILLFASPATICVVAGIAIIAAAQIKYWYYNRRLLCLRDRDCVIGALLAEPSVSTDGDRKLNVLPAPMTKAEVRSTLATHLGTNRTMLGDDANFPAELFPTGRPALPDQSALVNDPAELVKYMKALVGSNPADDDRPSNIYNQIVIGVIDRLMAVPAFRIYERHLRKLTADIPDIATFGYIPVDLAAPANASGSWADPDAKNDADFFNPVDDRSDKLNPMFRFDNDHTVPYLHCEIEGNNLAIWMDDIITAAAGILLGCIIAGPLGGYIGGAIAWLLKKLLDWLTGNDGEAGEPDVDWDDPTEEPAGGAFGDSFDSLLIYGDAIMDTEHGQYFEIHPVRAFYIMGRDGVPGSFDPAEIDNKDAIEKCTRVGAAEEEDRPDVILREHGTLLSWGADTRYAGGAPQIR